MILLVEDDLKISELILHLLRKDGYEVDHANDGEEALMYVSMNTYEIIVLDWMMPILDGVETCIKLRKNGYQGGILMLTAKDTLDDKIIGLDSGADDYLIKPFEYRELLARIKALSRRSHKSLAQDVLEIGDYKINRPSHTAYYCNKALELSKKEYLLFELLFENSPNTITRSTIIDSVWGLDGEISDNNLDAFIRLLRKKLNQKVKKKLIVNVRGIGYKMEI